MSQKCRPDTVLMLIILAVAIFAFRPGAGICAETTQYIYDELNRLRFVSYGDGTVIEYQYDKIGNITNRIVTGPTMNALTVSRSGNGSGTVTSDQAGINCGSDCAENYTAGALITLTATPATGYLFDGWSGACTGTSNTCVVSLTGNKSVTATFNLASLTVSKSGTGTGTITSSPSGISCGGSCSADYTTGTSIILSVAPDATSNFTGWSGACSGTGQCTLTMDAHKSATASFDLPTLTITKTGIGIGTVSSNPAGITCGGTCIQDFNKGTSVTLTATADSAWDFVGWSGACSGSQATCTISTNDDTGVTAEFGCLSQPVQIDGKGSYSTLQAAYNAAASGDIIKIRALELTESNVTLNRAVSVSIKGGYDCHFTTNSGTSTLKGQLNISNGTVNIKDLNLKY